MLLLSAKSQIVVFHCIRSQGYQFAFFTTNPSEEENSDIQIKSLHIVEVFKLEERLEEEGDKPEESIADPYPCDVKKREDKPER
ncbi:hypothetical protein TNCV_3646641 [Trichonephila clavipes]|nr:hypothetical protein TNCV_3646641 [Trichonephila clavipes]